jgi:DnaJ-class molecular chaperone
VVVKTPTRLSSRQKELLEEFALISEDSFKPLKKNFFRKLKDFLQS